MSSKRPIKNIPLNHLHDRKIGIQVYKINNEDPLNDHHMMRFTHRDSYYIFYIQQQGTVSMFVDFKEILIEGNAMGYILPGQVHYASHIKNVKAWSLAIDANLVNSKNKAQLEESLMHRSIKPLKTAQNEIMVSFLKLMDKTINYQKIHCDLPTTNLVLVDGFLTLFNQFYFEDSNVQPATQENRASMLSSQFRALVRAQYKTIKKPKDYAEILNVSTSYLNESLKGHTGFSLTYWIQQEVFIEAKRLLFYTDNTIKEIAYELGFHDHTYFSRLFQKTTAESPSSFRKRYRE